MRSLGTLTLFFCAALLSVASAAAQEPAPPPAHISFVEGTVLLDRDGGSEPATLNTPILMGDRLRTANGRAEVMFADGSAIAIDPDSDVEFITGTRVRVIAGAIEHLAAARDPRSPSGQALPPDLQPYGPDLDRNGAWQYDPSYGSVWYPTVAADWRPYYYGYWSPVPSYGLTWIGYDRWSWPTHHYGRWGYARSRWFWIPGRTWSAAWVSWGTSPDYYGWCPLGFDNRPIVALSVGYHNAWNAWTIVPRDRFLVHGASIHRYAVDPYRVAASTPFVVHRTAPAYASRGGIGVVGSTPRADANIAVPRYSREIPRAVQRVPTPGYERRSPTYTQPIPSAAPTYDRRAPSAMPTMPGATHPIYRPDYQPRYPSGDNAPRAMPRQMTPIVREGAPVRQAPPARAIAPAIPPSAHEMPAPRSSAPAQAAAPPASHGTAVPREGSRGQGRSESSGGRRPR